MFVLAGGGVEALDAALRVRSVGAGVAGRGRGAGEVVAAV
jgi:hypothetical protein